MKKGRFGVLILALSMLLAGCGGSSDKDKNAGAAGSSDTSAKDSLTVVIPTDVGKFNPQYTMTHADIYLGYQIYEHLVHYVDGEWKGQLADSWEFSDDKKTVTFHLREDAAFHSGDPVTAEDVKYSFDLNLERPGMASNREKIVDIKAEDEHTLSITMSYPKESILFELATPTWGIMNKSYCEENGEDAFINPDGSGAYKLKSWNKGSSIELEAYEDYTGEIGNIKNLKFEIIPDQSTAVIALEDGSVDLIVNAAAANVTLLQDNEAVEILSGASHTSSKLYMNVRSGETESKELRQAIAYAINRDSINTVIYEDRGEVSTGVFSDFMYYSGIDFSYEYNIEKAKELMKKAGLSNVSLTIKTSENYGSEVPTLIQENLAEIGIELKIESLESSAHSDDYLKGNFELWYSADSTVLPDISEMMYLNYHTPENTNKYFAPEADFINEKLEAARAEENAEKKTVLYDDIVMDVKDNAGQLDLVNAPSNLVYQKGLKNVYLDPNGMIYCYQYFNW